MAREMTSQERAAALIEQMLVFIEKTSRRKLSFSAIVDMNTGKTENPQDRLVAAVMKHDTDTRRAALLEAVQMIEDDCYGGVDYFSDADTTLSFTDQMKRAHNKNQAKLAEQVRKLAQEG